MSEELDSEKLAEALGRSMSDSEREWWEEMHRLSMASNEETRELTDDEVYGISVDVVTDKLLSDGLQIVEVSKTFGAEPAIWFKVNDSLKYIVTTFARYPAKARPPENVQEIIEQLKDQGAEGYWVGVGFAHELEPFDPDWDGGMKLMKGFAVLPYIGHPVALGEL